MSFRSPTTVKGSGDADTIALPIRCTEDATAFINTVNPQDGRLVLLAVHDGSSVIVNGNAIPALKDVETIDSYPTTSEIVFLVKGTPATAPASNSEADRPSFAAVFGRDGQYKRLTLLPANMAYSGIAMLESGNLIVAGYDSINEEQHMLILDDTGRTLRNLDQPINLSDRKKGLFGIESASTTHFTPHGQNVLVWRTGKRDPVIEVNSSLDSRELKLDLPKDDLIIDIVPSDMSAPIIAHLGTYRSIPVKNGSGAVTSFPPGEGPQEIINIHYLVYSSEDGMFLKKLSFSTHAINALACEVGGKYLAYSANEKKQLIEYQGQ